MMFDLKKIKFYTEEQSAYLSALLSELLCFYGGKLVSVFLFGSMASCNNRLNSDCDLLIVLDLEGPVSRRLLNRDFNFMETRLAEMEVRMFKSGVSMEISPLILTKQEALKFNPLYLDMVDNHLPIFDKDDFLAGVLSDMRKRFLAWGSSKHPVGNGWYWIIKKDICLGEVLNYDQ